MTAGPRVYTSRKALYRCCDHCRRWDLPHGADDTHAEPCSACPRDGEGGRAIVEDAP